MVSRRPIEREKRLRRPSATCAGTPAAAIEGRMPGREVADTRRGHCSRRDVTSSSPPRARRPRELRGRSRLLHAEARAGCSCGGSGARTARWEQAVGFAHDRGACVHASTAGRPRGRGGEQGARIVDDLVQQRASRFGGEGRLCQQVARTLSVELGEPRREERHMPQGRCGRRAAEARELCLQRRFAVGDGGQAALPRWDCAARVAASHASPPRHRRSPARGRNDRASACWDLSAGRDARVSRAPHRRPRTRCLAMRGARRSSAPRRRRCDRDAGHGPRAATRDRAGRHR